MTTPINPIELEKSIIALVNCLEGEAASREHVELVLDAAKERLHQLKRGLHDNALNPADLQVIFFGLKDYAPSSVVEYAIMPSGKIVVITDDRGAESLWFDSNGLNPKSYLMNRHTLEKINISNLTPILKGGDVKMNSQDETISKLTSPEPVTATGRGEVIETPRTDAESDSCFDPNEPACPKCHVSLFLLPGCEWNDVNPERNLCHNCALEEIDRLQSSLITAEKERDEFRRTEPFKKAENEHLSGLLFDLCQVTPHQDGLTIEQVVNKAIDFIRSHQKEIENEDRNRDAR